MQNFPLDWPAAYPRYAYSRTTPRFKVLSLTQAVDGVYEQVRMLQGKRTINIDDVQISSNVPLKNDGLPRADYMRSNISDPGVAVYFKHNKDNVVLCCDQWSKVEANLRAIMITIEDMRRIERNGVSDFLKKAFTGFKALPSGPAPQPWYEVFLLPSTPSRTPSNYQIVKGIYVKLLHDAHPDKGGSTDEFERVRKAWQDANDYFKPVM